MISSRLSLVALRQSLVIGVAMLRKPCGKSRITCSRTSLAPARSAFLHSSTLSSSSGSNSDACNAHNHRPVPHRRIDTHKDRQRRQPAIQRIVRHQRRHHRIARQIRVLQQRDRRDRLTPRDDYPGAGRIVRVVLDCNDNDTGVNQLPATTTLISLTEIHVEALLMLGLLRRFRVQRLGVLRDRLHQVILADATIGCNDTGVNEPPRTPKTTTHREDNGPISLWGESDRKHRPFVLETEQSQRASPGTRERCRPVHGC